MSEPVLHSVTLKLRPGCESAFAVWKARHDLLLGRMSGFISNEIHPPVSAGGNDWKILWNFRSVHDLAMWRESPEHADLFSEGEKLFEYDTSSRPEDASWKTRQGDVTEVIFSKIRPACEDIYREWSARMQAKQARYPGYRGTFFQAPDEVGAFWTTIVRFDSTAHLEAWMNAPERRAMLEESRTFVEHEQLSRLATSFPGWVPVDPETGKTPPNWKTALLVLLGLYPIVMLEMKFLNLAALGLPPSPATFVGNGLSVALTSFVTMPHFVRWFCWWLFPKFSGVTATGLVVIAGLFGLEILILWNLLP